MANNGLESSSLLELFDVPDHRIVHGNAFPIGVRLKETAPSKDITSILKELDLLAKTGIFNDLLRKRPHRPSHQKSSTKLKLFQTAPSSSATSPSNKPQTSHPSHKPSTSPTSTAK